MPYFERARNYEHQAEVSANRVSALANSLVTDIRPSKNDIQVSRLERNIRNSNSNLYGELFIRHYTGEQVEEHPELVDLYQGLLPRVYPMVVECKVEVRRLQDMVGGKYSADVVLTYGQSGDSEFFVTMGTVGVVIKKTENGAEVHAKRLANDNETEIIINEAGQITNLDRTKTSSGRSVRGEQWDLARDAEAVLRIVDSTCKRPRDIALLPLGAAYRLGLIQGEGNIVSFHESAVEFPDARVTMQQAFGEGFTHTREEWESIKAADESRRKEIWNAWCLTEK